MNKVQENKLSMYLYVEKVCNDNKNVWDNVKAFASAKNELSDVIHKLQEALQQQELTVKGVTQARTQTTSDLMKITLKYISALKIFAMNTNNKILLEDISITKSEMKRLRDSIFLEKCRFVFQKAKRYKEILIDYGMTDDIFNVFSLHLKTYKNQFSGTKEAMSKRKISTQEIKDLFKAGDIILKGKIDNFINIFSDSNPEFYKNYKNLRKIRHLGIKKAKARNESTDSGAKNLQQDLVAA